MTTSTARHCHGLLQLLLILGFCESFLIPRTTFRRDFRLFATTQRRVQPLTVGPILGATTSTEARIFGRGLEKKPCIGVARIRREDEMAYTEERSFRMRPAFDCTGVAVFQKLEALTKYTYQMGCIQQEIGESNLDWSTLDWSSVENHSFCTATATQKLQRSFVFGSCRHLLMLGEDGVFDDRGDKTFRSIGEQIDSGVETYALLMLGNQIYANELNTAGVGAPLPLFFERYRNAFCQDHIRALMARVPTYMVLGQNDVQHEMTLYPATMHSYLTYQASHSPLFDLITDRTHIAGVPTKLWYTFRDGCCDFFVMDCHTESIVCDDKNRQMISTEQMEALKSWLSDGAETVKFVASPTPLFPDASFSNDNTWSGFTDQRNEILDFIRQHKIPRVVFLSGNVCCSVSARLLLTAEPDFSVISIISSAFYWPYPNSWEPQLEGFLMGSNRVYQVEEASSVVRDNNFSRVTVSLDELTVEVFDRKGASLDKTRYSLKITSSSSQALPTSTMPPKAPVTSKPIPPAPIYATTATIPPPSPPPAPQTSFPTRAKGTDTASGVDDLASKSDVPAKKKSSTEQKVWPPWQPPQTGSSRSDAANDAETKKESPTTKKEKLSSKDQKTLKSWPPPQPSSSLSDGANSTAVPATNDVPTMEELPTKKKTPSKDKKPLNSWPPWGGSPSKDDDTTANVVSSMKGSKKKKEEEKKEKIPSKDEKTKSWPPWSGSPSKDDYTEADTKVNTTASSKDGKSPKSPSAPPASSPMEDTTTAAGADYLAAMSTTPSKTVLSSSNVTKAKTATSPSKEGTSSEAPPPITPPTQAVSPTASSTSTTTQAPPMSKPETTAKDAPVETTQTTSSTEASITSQAPSSPDGVIITQATMIPQQEPPSLETTMVPQELPPPEPPQDPVDGYVSTDSILYNVGEAIEVTYQVGHPGEWDYIAIFPASVSENDLHHSNAIQWVNTCEGDRKSLSCLGGSALLPLQFPPRRPEKFPLAAGDYNVYFLRLGETDVPAKEDIIAKSSFKVINVGIQDG